MGKRWKKWKEEFIIIIIILLPTQSMSYNSCLIHAWSDLFTPGTEECDDPAELSEKRERERVKER